MFMLCKEKEGASPPFKNSYINILSHDMLRSSVCQAFAWTKIGVVQALVELRSQSGEHEGYSPRLKHKMRLERWQELEYRRSVVCLHNEEFSIYLKAKWEITELSSKKGT